MRQVTRLSIAALVPLVAAVLVVGSYGGWRVIPVVSSSMRPALHVGDAALAKRIDSSHVRAGDIIVYKAPIGDHPLIIHRIVTVRQTPQGTSVQTKGDANTANDAWTATLNATVLRRTATLPWVGRPINYLEQFGLARIIACAAILVAAAVILRLIWVRRAK